MAKRRVARFSRKYEVIAAAVPMMMRGERCGSSQRNTDKSSGSGSATHPAVVPPLVTCRNIALPRPGVRAVLYAITAP